MPVFIAFLLSQDVGTDMLRRLSPWRELQAHGARGTKAACAVFLGAMLLSGSALAQSRDRNREAPPRPAGKGMDFCKADIHKFCEAADLKQECLVAHWSKISDRCQDVLAAPAQNDGDRN